VKQTVRNIRTPRGIRNQTWNDHTTHTTITMH
jgi:hypothetical protein